jgi:hypothetical protein
LFQEGLRDNQMIGSPMRFMNPQISSPGRVTPLSHGTLQPSWTQKLQNSGEFGHAEEECPSEPQIHL